MSSTITATISQISNSANMNNTANKTSTILPISTNPAHVDQENLSSLSNEEQLKIKELRDRLGPKLLKATPMFDDDQSLLRWIEGWDSKWNEILPRFKKASQIMEALGTNKMDFEGTDEVNEYVRKLCPASDYFGGGLMGYDREGNTIVMQSMGQTSPKLILQCERVSSLFQLSIIEAILTNILIKKQEKKFSRRVGIVVIVDLEGLNMEHIYNIKIYTHTVKMLQDMFPDVAKKIFVINAPSLFASVYNLAKPAVAEKTRQRVRILGHSYSEQLCDELGAENIYPHWGGTKVAKIGSKETGNLRMGGKPPDQLRYISSSNPFHINDSLLTKINVPARSRKLIEIECVKSGQILQWFFYVSSEIDFHIELKQKMGDQNEEENVKLIVPKYRLHTEFVPEYNSIKCEKTGVYVLVFDNQFSTFSSKDVRYFVGFNEEKLGS